MTLSELYASGNYKTDKGTSHDYINGFYNELFSPLQEKKVKILEIGILTGESLKLWRDFFVNGEIWGIDATVQKPANFVQDTFVLLGDAYNKKYVDKLPTGFDFIIDDAIHSVEKHKKVIELYASKVKKGGSIIIEDLQKFSDLEEVMSFCPKGWSVEYLDLRKNKGRFDDVIIKFTK
jgi:hypothetical protein